MRLRAIRIHPVKSLRGFDVEEAHLDELGLAGDRRFLVVDPEGNMYTQRNAPLMARVDALLGSGELTLRREGFGEVHTPCAPDPCAPLVQVQVWADAALKAEDCGEAPARWLSEALGAPARLVRIGPDFARPVKPERALPGDRVHFADAYPLLVVGLASLADLNDRIAASGSDPVPMERFRPNLILEGCSPFAEDRWSRIRLGGVVLRNAGPSARCIVTTIDQQSGERLGPEPLRTLAAYRRDPEVPAKVFFGCNYVNESKRGTVRVGDGVEVLG